mgnify:CR=1 FL=1
MKTFQCRVEPEGIYIYLTTKVRKLFKKTDAQLELKVWGDDVSSSESQVLRGLSTLNEFIDDVDDLSAYEVLIPHNAV